ncbi:hypothetical protein R1A27_16475 [Methylobacterium sp. NMS12]|uniref:hypothetical protein n=1 Tax=Methylobacterium sp. NMS12 TaxID=3079766 RepID=UPI003F880F15
MAADIRVLYDALTPDPHRAELGFEKILSAANDALLAADDEEASHILRKWLGREQPCLFGRVAAKRDLLSFCFVREADLNKGDEYVREKIQAARLTWSRDGFRGRKSGFIVAALSRRLIDSEPNQALQAFAARLGSLYLMDDIFEDRVYFDEVYLERPDSRRTLKWLAGVNVFASAADGRWWQDHRIPGGLAFSVNSVGHMVASSRLARAEGQIDSLFEDDGNDYAQQAVDSLEKALQFAMRTIDNAAESISGKATLLIPDEGGRQCPISLPPNLMGKSCFEYAGFYHTDYTVPALYFRPDVRRPTPETAKFDLDFTYLFEDSPDNFAHQTMGKGRKLRGDLDDPKHFLAHPKMVPIDGETRLALALHQEGGG